MKRPAFCCGTPPIIFTGKDAEMKDNHCVSCLVCGREEYSRDREVAVGKFNKSIERDKAHALLRV